jgi:hypothetical protein
MTRKLVPVDQLSMSVNLSLFTLVGKFAVGEFTCRSVFGRSVITTPNFIGKSFITLALGRGKGAGGANPSSTLDLRK